MKGISLQLIASLGAGTADHRELPTFFKWALGVDLLLARGHTLTQKLCAASDPLHRPCHSQRGTLALVLVELTLKAMSFKCPLGTHVSRNLGAFSISVSGPWK